MISGLHRYAFHIPSLAQDLKDINVFRPKLILDGVLVRVSFELSDLTSTPRAKCFATLAAPGQASGRLMSHKEVEDLMPLIQAQDRNPDFRATMGASQLALAKLRIASESQHQAHGKRDTAGQRIVVFCDSNEVGWIANFKFQIVVSYTNEVGWITNSHISS